MKTEYSDQMLDLVRQKYPGWAGFDHPEFVKDEIEYKQEASSRARELLSEAELERLLADDDFEEIITRIRKIGSSTNLLFLGVPMQGDLGIINQDGLNKPEFCQAFADLLHGPDDSQVRLERYLQWVDANELPSKWTFPTYFLFLVHPEKEIFVKPTATSGVLKLMGSGESVTGTPTAAHYGQVLAMFHDLQTALEEFEPRHLIDVQSFAWVAYWMASQKRIRPTLLEETGKLIQEFSNDYVETPEGRKHLAYYVSGRAEAQSNFDSIIEARDRGEGVTEAVLARLLPHSYSSYNKERGAWISIAPAINKDIQSFFEAADNTDPSDWPEVATSILDFVETCVTAPLKLESACEEFAEKEVTTGFQTGMLTPILNALDPDDFLIINNKSRQVINHLAGTKYPHTLLEYPEINRTGMQLVDELTATFTATDLPEELRPSDAFDMFCHWMVAKKKYNFGQQYWKIAPGEKAWNWEACREGGYIAIGWDDFGDITGLSRPEFEARMDELCGEFSDWTKTGARQVWRFFRIKEGDRVVANRGKSEVLGIGTVTGPYYFVGDIQHGHRLPVDWDDTAVRQVQEKGWQRTIVKLDRTKFEEIVQSPIIHVDPPPTPADTPFSLQTFKLLANLQEQPTKDFYLSRKADFAAHVETPFQELLSSVGNELPLSVRENLETEKGILGRILKNDWGRGGAWDFYWGAFYPNGGKRIRDAQLYLWLNHEVLRYGFSFGAYSSGQRERFVKNTRALRASLPEMLQPTLDREGLQFGALEHQHESEGLPTWREWLNDPERFGLDIEVRLTREEVLARQAGVLRTEITDTFAQLYPLVLLATLDDPVPAIESYLEGDNGGNSVQPPYPLNQAADDTGFDEQLLERWVRAIERKGQAVVYGPPGTGKTYLAERLARHLVGGTSGFWELVQFHPAYAYEDFIQGIRPRTLSDGSLTYDVVKGHFLNFCNRAAKADGKAVLIVDEINRANLSRVFGELMYLLEYRDAAVPLAGGGTLRIPENVRLIGTMNTADRSIALVDHALRRRFAFLPLQPQYDVLRRFHENHGTDLDIERLIVVLTRLNNEIGDHNYEVGITFFLREDLQEHLEDIWRMEIQPYLEEFFFDQLQKADRFSWKKVEKDLLG